MDDVEEWSIVDIDSANKNNSLAVVEYIDDATTRRQILGCVPPNRMEQQSDIS